MNHEESFKAWLPSNGVNGDSVRSYVSYISSVEKSTGVTIDNLLKAGIDNSLNRVNNEVIPGKADTTLKKYKSAVKKYWEFLRSK